MKIMALHLIGFSSEVVLKDRIIRYSRTLDYQHLAHFVNLGTYKLHFIGAIGRDSGYKLNSRQEIVSRNEP